MISDVLMNVAQMMIRAQTQVVVIVAVIMIRKKLVPHEGQGVQDKLSLIKVGQTRSFGCPAMQ